ncbi:MAG: YIP1 family protein [bacterium]
MGTFAEFAETCRSVLISPFAFFRRMPVTEGVSRAVYFALIMYYFRCVVYFIISYRQGYFLIPEIAVNTVSITFAAIFFAAAPFFLLLILYTQAVLLNSIGVFFGGIGNFEGAFKVLAFTLFISLFILIPGVGYIAHTYAVIVLIIGIHEVYAVDWISSILAIFFSYLFTSVLYVILFVPPAFLSKIMFSIQ